MKNKGWVKLWRNQFNNWLSEKKPWCDGYAWTFLYSEANYKKGMANFRNEYIPVDRGQYITSKIKLANKFGWTYRHVGNFLKALENDQMIAYRTTNRYIVVTIINYDKYQGDDNENDEQNEEQIKNRLRTDDERGNTNKNYKNDKNVNNNNIYTFWNEQKIIIHRNADKYKSTIKTALKNYSKEELKTAITNYKIILNDENYILDKKWELGEFLKRKIDRFLDLETAKSFYKNYKNNNKPQKSMKDILKEWNSEKE
jgi:hypothetical protein